MPDFFIGSVTSDLEWGLQGAKVQILLVLVLPFCLEGVSGTQKEMQKTCRELPSFCIGTFSATH